MSFLDFNTITLCPQKVDKYIAKTNVQKSYHIKVSGLRDDQGLMVLLFLFCY